MNCGRYRVAVAGEIDTAVDQAVTSGHRDLVVSSARLALSLPDALGDRGNKEREFWPKVRGSCSARPKAVSMS